MLPCTKNMPDGNIICSSSSPVWLNLVFFIISLNTISFSINWQNIYYSVIITKMLAEKTLVLMIH